MKKLYLKLLTLAFCLYGGATTVNAQDYEWDFTASELWTANLTTGYYTPKGGSTPLETEPTDSKSIYVCSSGGLQVTKGSYYRTSPATLDDASLPTDNYIKLEIPAGYTIKIMMKLSATTWSNTFYLLIRDSEDKNKVQDITKKNTSFEECTYKNDNTATVTAYLYNTSGATRYVDYQYIKLIEPATVSHSYTVKFTDGMYELQDAVTGTKFEKESYTVNVPKVINKDGDYYVLDKSDDRHDFSETYTMGTADEVKTFTYTKDESVVFFEDYSGKENAAASGKGTLPTIDGSRTVYEALPAGSYSFNTNIFQYSSANRTANLQIDGETIESMPEKQGVKTVLFNVVTPGKLSISKAGDYSTQLFDYALIRKVGEAVTEQEVQIGEAGYATYVTPYAMDFSGNADIEAYLVTEIDETNSKVVLEKADKVPAGTAVVVKGKTANVAVCNSAAAVTNVLKSSNEDIVYSETATDTYYILAKVDGKVVFAPVSEGTIAAGKGYFTIKKATAASAKTFSFSFQEGEPTGVSMVEKVQEERDGAAYNLAGQRVSANAKGLLIIDGKKVIK